MVGFIFGGNTGQSAESLRRQRQIAEQLQARSVSSMPQNVGEGLSAIGMAIAGKIKEKRADKRLAEGERGASEAFDAIVASLGGSPGALARSDRVGTPFVPPTDGRRSPPPFDPAAIEADLDGMTQPGSVTDPQTVAMRTLVSKGYPPHIAAGLVGNLVQESGPNLNTTAVGDGGNSFGAGQWNGPRKRALMQFAAEQGMDPNALDTQLAFLDHEMKGPEAAAWQAIQTAKTPEEAALIASEKFWRPGDPRNENRTRYAANAYSAFAPDQTVADADPIQMVARAMPQQPQQGGIDPRLLQLAGNDFLSDGQRSVVQALLQNQFAQMQPSKPTDDMREYELARQQGYRGSFFDFQRDIRAAGRSQTSVTVGGPQAPDPMAVAEAKGREKGVEALATSAVETFNEGRNAAQQIVQIDQLEGLLAQTPTGTIPAWQQWANDTLGIQVTGGPAQAASAIISQLIPAQRPPGSGAASDADMRLFRAALPSLVNTPEGNAEIIAGMRAIAEYKAVISQIAGDAVAGLMSYGDMTERMREADAALSANLRARREAMPDMYGKPENPDALRSRLRDLGVN